MTDKKIIAIDFDGTIVTDEFPKVGKLLRGAKATIRALRNNGHHVFLWTVRTNTDDHPHVLDDAIEFLKNNEIYLDGVNHSPFIPTKDSIKQYANVYIDDLNLGAPLILQKRHDGAFSNAIDWGRVAFTLYLNGYITFEQADYVQKVVNLPDYYLDE